MRVAALDVGSNSVRMLVAEHDRKRLEPVASFGAVTRLAEGVETTGKLSVRALARTVAAVREMEEKARGLRVDTLRVVATGVVRRSSNAGALVGLLRDAAGLRVDLLSGDEEGRLCLLGAWRSLGLGPASERLVDVGGGSTELVEGTPTAVERVFSVPLGCVMLTETFLRTDPPTTREIAALRSEAGRQLAALHLAPRPGRVVATGGTATSLISISLSLPRYAGDRVHGRWLSKEYLERISDELASLSLARRKRLEGLSAKRADIIVAGAIILSAALDAWGADGYLVSDKGLRHGIVLELLGLD